MSFIKVFLLFLFLISCSGSTPSNDAGNESLKDKTLVCYPKTDGTGFKAGFKGANPDEGTYWDALFKTKEECEAKLAEIYRQLNTF